MINLIKLHFKYLFSKLMIIIILIILSLLTCYFLYEASIYEEFAFRYIYADELFNNYNNTSIIIIKLIIPILIIYIYGVNFLSSHDNYCIIIIKSRKERILYFISKIIIFSIVLFFILFILYFINFIIGVIFIPNYLYNSFSLLNWLNIFITSIIFSLITVCLVLLFNNSIVYILTIIFYLILQMIIESNDKFCNFISFLIPVMNINNLYVFDYVTIICYFLFYFLISCYIYYYKDM